MAALGCKRLQSDSGLFVHKSKDSTVVIVVYVDDALFIGNDRALVNKLKSDFMRKWECRDLGDVKQFLRMRIIRKGDSIYLDQSAYLDKVLQHMQ